VIGVIADPDGHFLTTFEHSPLYQERPEFDGPELGIFGADGLLSQIADIEVIHLSVEEHVERDLVAGFEMIEIQITHKENSAQYILYTGWDLIYPFRRDSRTCILGESNVLVCLIPPFVDIPDEFIRLQRGSVDVCLIAVPYLKELVIKGIGLAIGYHMIYILSIELVQRCVKGGLSCRNINAGQGVEDFVSNRLPCLKGGITNRTGIIPLSRGLRKADTCQQ
jgi:hypothetical protein